MSSAGQESGQASTHQAARAADDDTLSAVRSSEGVSLEIVAQDLVSVSERLLEHAVDEATAEASPEPSERTLIRHVILEVASVRPIGDEAVGLAPLR
jgi:hypothetical protein